MGRVYFRVNGSLSHNINLMPYFSHCCFFYLFFVLYCDFFASVIVASVDSLKNGAEFGVSDRHRDLSVSI
jgi:hypothetical protein